MNADTKIDSHPKVKGARISAICSCILLLLFFAPWVRSCQSTYSGYDLAREEYLIEESSSLYTIPIMSLVVLCFSALILAWKKLPPFILEIVSSLNIGCVIGAIWSTFSVFRKILDFFDAVEWGLLLSFVALVGIFVGSIIDIKTVNETGKIHEKT